ncbi:MAG: hypothetical protein LH616_17420 [Ilumatobacteraceae bacterium]|nr:hypothetical protein [Ilumatobacteraceae bacterium]
MSPKVVLTTTLAVSHPLLYTTSSAPISPSQRTTRGSRPRGDLCRTVEVIAVGIDRASPNLILGPGYV